MSDIEVLRALEADYVPSEEVAETLRQRTLLAFIGAFAVGKTTLMDRIAESDARFSKVVGFTTRPSRGPEDVYRFIEHTPENISRIVTQVQNRELANFTVHPTTEYIYGTAAEDYATEFCMLATIANNYHLATSKLPFRSVRPVIIVVEPEQWQERIYQRPTSKDELRARMTEAKQSLEWSLTQTDAYFIDNTSRDIATTVAQSIEDLSTAHDSPTSAKHRDTCQRMLSYINTSLEK